MTWDTGGVLLIYNPKPCLFRHTCQTSRLRAVGSTLLGAGWDGRFGSESCEYCNFEVLQIQTRGSIFRSAAVALISKPRAVSYHNIPSGNGDYFVGINEVPIVIIIWQPALSVSVVRWQDSVAARESALIIYSSTEWVPPLFFSKSQQKKSTTRYHSLTSYSDNMQQPGLPLFYITHIILGSFEALETAHALPLEISISI